MAFFAPIEGELESELYSSLEPPDDDPQFAEYQPIEYEMPEEWTNLLEETKGLEDEYRECSKQAYIYKQKIARKYDNIQLIRRNAEAFEDTSLKEAYTALLDKYELEVNLTEDMTALRIILGKRNALKKVLGMNKHEEIRACPICCETEVEKFLDPCGHTFCGPCLSKSPSNNKCPVCRTKYNNVRQLFFN
jgi:hypothetical protein